MKRSADDNEEEMKEIHEVPPYREGSYDIVSDDYSLENLEKIINHRDILMENIEDINEYAEIYCTYPTQENKINVRRHIIAYARACAYYGRKNVIHEEIENILDNLYIEEGEDGWEDFWRIQSDFNDETYKDEKDDADLQRIADECVYLLYSTLYIM